MVSDARSPEFDEFRDPTPESTDAFCSECLSLMVEDNGAGHLCPVCDVHPLADCGTAFPCSGYPALRGIDPCVLNAPLGSVVAPPCPCGCPPDMHIGEIGCPCALPGEPPCVVSSPGEAASR